MPSRKWSRSSLTIQVPVPDDRTQAETRQEGAQRLHQHHRAVTAAGAADRHREVGLALALVERKEELHEPLQPRPQLAALRERHHELLHRRMAAGEGPE